MLLHIVCLLNIGWILQLVLSAPVLLETDKFPFYYPRAQYSTIDPLELNFNASTQPLGEQERIEEAQQILSNATGITSGQWHFNYETTVADITHLYFYRKLDGIQVLNQRGIVHMKDGRVIAFSATASQNGLTKRTIPGRKLSEAEAKDIVMQRYKVSVVDGRISERLMELPGASLAPVYEMQIINASKNAWAYVAINALTGATEQYVDFSNSLNRQRCRNRQAQSTNWNSIISGSSVAANSQAHSSRLGNDLVQSVGLTLVDSATLTDSVSDTFGTSAESSPAVAAHQGQYSVSAVARPSSAELVEGASLTLRPPRLPTNSHNHPNMAISTSNDSHAFTKMSGTPGNSSSVLVTSSVSPSQILPATANGQYMALSFHTFKPLDGFVWMNASRTNSSPLGWHDNGAVQFQNLTGNNVAIRHPNISAPSSAILEFDTDWHDNEEPSVLNNAHAAMVNMFYITNRMHDIMYQFGFTEAAGNFQDNNFGKGGNSGDHLQVIAQSDDGINDSVFFTPPDGQSPIMKMYLFDSTVPKRDAGLENTVIMHEYFHGVSKRLSGGPQNLMCLQGYDQTALAEGWSDAVSLFLTTKPTDTRDTIRVYADYVSNNADGLRPKPYSTNIQLNPDTFSAMEQYSLAHEAGSIWAVALWEMFWNLIDKNGFDDNWDNATSLAGNVVALKLVITGLTLQPCNPTYTNARDAILQADTAIYQGKNRCAIWAAFAKRGLGTDADADSYGDGFKLPQGCT